MNKMEQETLISNYQPGTLQSILPTVGPAILVSIGYVDPGKWAAIIDGGARFGIDLLIPLLIFNIGAILCQYLAAKIAVVSGKNLAQICRDEYDKSTCMFLGIQTLISVVALDLTTIVGMAHALNHLLGVDLSTCVFVTAVDAVSFPLFAALMDKYKAKLLHISIGSFILLSYVLGVFSSQPEVPLPNGMLTKLSGESAFALMSLLGASVMPHCFYLHSAIVMQQSEPQNVSKESLSHGHFLSISCIFSGIYLVNYVLLNSAANVFNSTGLILLTFPDAMSLMEQVLRSPVTIFVFLIILYLVNQLSGWTWNLGGQEVLHGFLRLDIPNWLQHITIRTFSMALALYCVWTSGVEGLYQLLIYTQVIIAIVLPASVIPLFRIASSRAIMSSHKISPLLEFLSLITFLGMLCLKSIFVVDMIFGDSDWVGNLRWNMGSSSSFPYIILLCTACASFCLMLWLAATPLKSATQIDPQVWSWDVQTAIQEPSLQREETCLEESGFEEEEPVEKQEQLPLPVRNVEYFADKRVENIDHDLPEEIIDQEIHSSTIEESHFGVAFPSPPTCHLEEAVPVIEPLSEPLSSEVNKIANGHLLDAETVKTKSIEPIEKTVAVVKDLLNEKEDDEGDTMPSLSDGPASLRSLSGKSEDGGNGPGSLSRLAGLGRAARRQFASALDEFWGQLFDFHGQITQEAKEKKLDVLLLIDLKLASLKVDTGVTEPGGSFPSVGVRTSNPFATPSLCNSPKQLMVQSNVESHGVQSGSSPLWSNRMQLLDAYVQGSSHNVVDSGERRYSSLRTLPSSDTYEDQPATVHYVVDSGERRYSSLRNLPSFAAYEDQSTPVHGYVVDSGERRYSSLRTLPSSDAYEHQPATVHGYVADSGERRYSSLRTLPSSDAYEHQPATVHGYVADSGERRYSSLRTLPSSDAYEHHSATVHGYVADSGERRYSSLRTLPSSDAYEHQSATVHGYVADSGERRYSSLRTLPSSDAYEHQPATVHGYVADSGERRYSSLRTLSSSDAYEDQPATVHGYVADSSERRYSSLRTLPSSDAYEVQPATAHAYQISSSNRIARERGSKLNGQMESSMSLSATVPPKTFRDPVAVSLAQKLPNGKHSPLSSGLQSAAVSRNSSLQRDRSYLDAGPPGFTDKSGVSSNSKKYHSLPDISGLVGPYRDQYMPEKSAQLGNSVGFGSPLSTYEPPGYSNNAMGYGNFSFSGSGIGARNSTLVSSAGSLGYTEPPMRYTEPLSFSGSLWSKQPYEQFGHYDKISTAIGSGLGSRSNLVAREATSLLETEAHLLRSFRCCIAKLLKLEGSDWLFRHGDGADEELIDRVAARERFFSEAEARELNQAHMNEPQYAYPDWKSGSALKNSEAGLESIMVSSVPHCGDGCVWKSDLLISFGIWCIHRILDLSQMESRPELWGKYTYVLNRLQGVIDPAFSKPRSAASPCFCLQIPATSSNRSSPPAVNGLLPPTAKPSRGKCTNAATLLELIKEVEMAISCRKGRSGTAAGDVAFPKGKENLASVLKRYKRRLSNKHVGK